MASVGACLCQGRTTNVLKPSPLPAVTDLPWGVRELTNKAVAVLYPRLLRTLAAAMRPGGYAILLCGNRKQLSIAIAQNEATWEHIAEKVRRCHWILPTLSESDERRGQSVNVEGIAAQVTTLRRR